MIYRGRLLVILAGMIMLVGVVLAYRPALRGALLWDDHVLVEDSARHRAAGIGELFLEPYWPDSPLSDARAAYYRPIMLLSVRADLVFGPNAEQLHLTNVALHLVACALLAIVAWRLGASGSASVLAALAWGLLPRLSEAVAWVSGRTDVLAGLFALAAIAVAPDACARPPPRSSIASARAFGSGLLLLVALLSKEVAIAAAGALVVCAVLRREGETARSDVRIVRAGINVAFPVVVYGVLRTIALTSVTAQHRALGPALRSLTVLEATGRYVAMTFDAFRPRTSIGMIGALATPFVVLGALAIVGGVALAWRGRRGPFGIVIGGALAVFALVPVIQIVPLSMSGAVVADRALYVPLAGVAIALAVAARSLGRTRSFVAAAFACAFAFGGAIVTHARAFDYQGELGFWLVAAEGAHPLNTAPRSALAAMVRDAGATDLGCRLFATATRIHESSGGTASPAYRRSRENHAACVARLGRYDEALAEYLALVRDHPDAGRIHMGLAYVRMHMMDFDAASAELARAVELDPRIAPLVRQAVGALTVAREKVRAFAGDAARKADPVGYADSLAAIGRAPDAEAVLVSVALDPTTPLPDRVKAIDRLADFGTVANARRALDASPDVPFRRREDFVNLITRRERKLAGVHRVADRIERLAR